MNTNAFKQLSKDFWNDIVRSERLRLATCDWDPGEWVNLYFSRKWHPEQSIIKKLGGMTLDAKQIKEIADAYSRELREYAVLTGIPLNIGTKVQQGLTRLRVAADVKSLADALETAFQPMP